MNFESIKFGIVFANMFTKERDQAYLFGSSFDHFLPGSPSAKNGCAYQKMGFRVLMENQVF